MSEKRFTSGYSDYLKNARTLIKMDNERLTYGEIVDLLNKQDEKIQRWKNLYELKDAEVTARVDALNKVCNYYLIEIGFKSDVDPNKAVKEVINRILNTEVEM